MKILSFIFAMFLLYSCSSSTDPKEPNEAELEKKIGQMLLIGFRGLTVEDSSAIVDDIRNGRIGGVVLFDRDVALASNIRNIQSPEQVKNLIESLQSYSQVPLFVAVDQEGGRVARLKESYGFPHNVSQQYLGDLDNIDSTTYYSQRTANTLSQMGFNVNFAPVVDLNINPESPAIGKIERSFSANPEIVEKHSKIVIQSHHQKNIACVLKHFPGHGSASVDSHLGFTDVTNTWSQDELLPYSAIINASLADAVMTAHIFNANLDPDYPATLSKNIITNILRNELNFNGVIFSDDMNMAAINDHWGLETALELSINAGVDVIIFGNNLIYDPEIAIKAQRIIKDLVLQGKISMETINKSYNRVINLKRKYSVMNIAGF